MTKAPHISLKMPETTNSFQKARRSARTSDGSPPSFTTCSSFSHSFWKRSDATSVACALGMRSSDGCSVPFWPLPTTG